ncbi:MAG: hypothetical protein LBS27_01945 [Bifidobacteriaceae bacterium]|jgi:hypothetical protein|nr:hypothetical protein [Bifidobacteriaceae bacterium]
MRKRLLIALTCLGLATALSGCGSSGGDETETNEPKVDDGTVVVGDPKALDQLDEELPIADKVEEGWISAPWGNVTKPDPDSQELQIYYVDGDTVCYGHAGFSLDEADSKVTVGVYVLKVPDATDCPANPARAFKWGTVKLAKPLGDRELVHVGLQTPYQDFVWDEVPLPGDGGQDGEEASTEPSADSENQEPETEESP